LRYPRKFIINIGPGLIGTTGNIDADFSFARITQGTGNVSWTV
jgi:hypothetical protein